MLNKKAKELIKRGFEITQTDDDKLEISNTGFAGLIDNTDEAIAVVIEAWDRQRGDLANNPPRT